MRLKLPVGPPLTSTRRTRRQARRPACTRGPSHHKARCPGLGKGQCQGSGSLSISSTTSLVRSPLATLHTAWVAHLCCAPELRIVEALQAVECDGEPTRAKGAMGPGEVAPVLSDRRHQRRAERSVPAEREHCRGDTCVSAMWRQWSRAQW